MVEESMLPNVYSFGYSVGQTLSIFVSWCYRCYHDQKSSNLITSFPTIISQVWIMIKEFPFVYREWWLNLVVQDPVHVFVETALLITVVYLLVSRNKDWKASEKRKGTEKLTLEEEEALLKEWRENCRVPLGCEVPVGASSSSSTTTSASSSVTLTSSVVDENNSSSTASSNSNNNHVANSTASDNGGYATPIIHKMDGRIMEISLDDDDEKFTVLNFANFDFLGMSGGSSTLSSSLSSTTKETKNEISTNKENSGTAANSAKNDTTTIVNGYGDSVKDSARKALAHYGCGSCGPRGFYGTIDVHLELEEEFSNFLGTDGAILYSDGASTCSSTVAAFAKRGDLLFVDEGIYEPLVAGVKLSRAYVKWFKHNDMDDLRRILEISRKKDEQLGRKPNAQRRFIIVEGLYKNTGKICPLDELIPLKHEYNCRLILDESHSFGTLGKTGKGSLELHNKRIMYDAEIVTISLEHAVGSIGGITVGSAEVVDHQRLSGSGYCFSASSPPFTASAAIQSLRVLQQSSNDDKNTNILQRLNENKHYMYEKLQYFCTHQVEGLFMITTDPRSCICYIVLTDCPETESIIAEWDEIDFLNAVNNECLRRGVAFIVTTGGLIAGSPDAYSTTTAAAGATSSTTKALSTSNSSTTTTTTTSVCESGASNGTRVASANDSGTTNNDNNSSNNDSSGATASNNNKNNSNNGKDTANNNNTQIKQQSESAGTLLYPPPAIRISITAAQTKDDIDKAIQVLSDSVDHVTKRFIDNYS